MRHSQSILLLYGSADHNRAEKSREVQGTDGRDSTVRHMDKQMEFYLG